MDSGFMTSAMTSWMRQPGTPTCRGVVVARFTA